MLAGLYPDFAGSAIAQEGAEYFPPVFAERVFVPHLAANVHTMQIRPPAWPYFGDAATLLPDISAENGELWGEYELVTERVAPLLEYEIPYCVHDSYSRTYRQKSYWQPTLVAQRVLVACDIHTAAMLFTLTTENYYKLISPCEAVSVEMAGPDPTYGLRCEYDGGGGRRADRYIAVSYHENIVMFSYIADWPERARMRYARHVLEQMMRRVK